MRYFAYGANLDRAHMAECCPGAVPRGPAVLPGYRLRIARAGYATVEPEEGARVLGFLWELGPADLAALDRFESVGEGLYYRDQAGITGPRGDPETAMLYRASDPAPGIPNPGYLERVIALGRELGFPESYLGELGRLAGPPLPPSARPR